MSGKGDKPRNCFTSKFRNNFDEIIWTNKQPNKKKKISCKTGKKSIKYF